MKFFLVALILVSGFQAHAFRFNSKADRENYLTVSSIEIKEVPTLNLHTARIIDVPSKNLRARPQGPDDVLNVLTNPDVIDSWITLGKKIWQIVVDNKPVTNVATQRVSVLPEAQVDWRKMDSWQGPVSKSYSVELKNLYGMTVIKHSYTIAFNYGGQYEGRGQYLANATIIPSRTEVMWGYTFNSKVEVGETVNVGTRENPIPGVELQVQYSVDTVIKHGETRAGYFVRGDGQLIAINPQPL